jgi:uncharacterized protein YheU (UPF0270 family)
MHDEDDDERRLQYEADPRDRPEPVLIPHTELSPNALRGVIDNFILREGTDYGDRIVSHDEKVAQVLLQLERHEARILFDPLDSSVTIVPVATFRRDRDTTRR